jgi:hypothetical protein
MDAQMQPMRRRAFLRVVGLAGAVPMLLSACAPAPPASAPPPTSPPPSATLAPKPAAAPTAVPAGAPAARASGLLPTYVPANGVLQIERALGARLGPDPPGGVDDQLQLAALFIDGQWVAGDRGGEAALRTESQILDRHILRGFLNSAQ